MNSSATRVVRGLGEPYHQGDVFNQFFGEISFFLRTAFLFMLFKFYISMVQPFFKQGFTKN